MLVTPSSPAEPWPMVLLSIVTWNSAESVNACLESILAQTYPHLQVLVVDNASADATCTHVERWTAEDPRVRLHRMPHNTGFCGGHNYAIEHSTTPLVLLVNPDIIMAPDYVAHAISAMQADEAIGCVCGLLLQSEERDPRVDSAGLLALPDGRFQLRAHGERLSQLPELRPCLVDGADGALPLFQRACIADVSVQNQFFDERFFAHKEDWDIAWRTKLYGWRTLFTPACRAIHPRQFRPGNFTLRQKMVSNVKYHAVKNQGILWMKNIPKRKLMHYALHGSLRQVAIFLYCLLWEPASLRAYHYLLRNWRSIMHTRRIVQARAKRELAGYVVRGVAH